MLNKLPNDTRILQAAGNAISDILYNKPSPKILLPITIKIGTPKQELDILASMLPEGGWKAKWSYDSILAFWYCAERYLRSVGKIKEAKVFEWLRSIPEDKRPTQGEYLQTGGSSTLAFYARSAVQPVWHGGSVERLEVYRDPDWSDPSYIAKNPSCLIAYTHPTILGPPLSEEVLNDTAGLIWHNKFYDWEYLWDGVFATSVKAAKYIDPEENTILLGGHINNQDLRNRVFIGDNTAPERCILTDCVFVDTMISARNSKIIRPKLFGSSRFSYTAGSTVIRDGDYKSSGLALHSSIKVTGNVSAARIERTKINSSSRMAIVDIDQVEDESFVKCHELITSVIENSVVASDLISQNSTPLIIRKSDISGAYIQSIDIQIRESSFSKCEIVAPLAAIIVSKFNDCAIRIKATRALIEKSVFKNTTFNKSKFIDNIFNSCDLSGCDMRGSYFDKVSFVDCDLRGTRFRGATLKDVTFKNCMRNSGDPKILGTRVFGEKVQSYTKPENVEDYYDPTDYLIQGPPYKTDEQLYQDPENWYEPVEPAEPVESAESIRKNKLIKHNRKL